MFDKLKTLLAAALLPAFILDSPPISADTPSLASDPSITKQFNRKNYEPGGENFLFGSHRGGVTGRTGRIRVLGDSSVELGGGMVIQQLSYGGQIGYRTRFSGHGWQVHGPFDETASRSGYGRGMSAGSGNGSAVYQYSISASKTHPADGYDGPQGGGFPTPSKHGPHDIYSYTVQGHAFRHVQKPLDKSFWLKSLINAQNKTRNDISDYAEHASSRMAAAFNQFNGLNTLRSVNGVTEGVLFVPSAGVQNAIRMEVAKQETGQYYAGYASNSIQQNITERLSPERQYRWLETRLNVHDTEEQFNRHVGEKIQWAADSVQQWSQEHPYLREFGELGLTLAPVAGRPLKQGFAGALNTVKAWTGSGRAAETAAAGSRALVRTEVADAVNARATQQFKNGNAGHASNTTKPYASLSENKVNRDFSQSYTCSFDGNTQVKTLSGYKPIADINREEQVFSKDKNSGKTGYKTVLKQYSNLYSETVYLTLADENSHDHTIKSNRIHPFYSEGKWIQAGSLKAGDRLLSESGVTQVVKSIHIQTEVLKAYNLTVADWHSYFVRGADGQGEGVWVSNDCPTGGHLVNSPRIYEDAPYHGKHNNTATRKNQAPTNGQKALNNSVQITENSPRRIGIDTENKEFVVLDRTNINVDGSETFHGHVRSWKELRSEQQNALIRDGRVNRKGKIK